MQRGNMPDMNAPILYSFRRCPYAMRARFALAYSGIICYLREVDLKHKPQAMLDISPKGTVPVLQLPDGSIIDESLEIIHYALSQNDPNGWSDVSADKQAEIDRLIKKNDTEFTPLLRKYKYFERYPESLQQDYRQEIEALFLRDLEKRLGQHAYIAGEHISTADIAIFPYIRQFAYADEEWFFTSGYTYIIKWLQGFLDDPLFDIVMRKYMPWKEGDVTVVFP